MIVKLKADESVFPTSYNLIGVPLKWLAKICLIMTIGQKLCHESINLSCCNLFLISNSSTLLQTFS